MELIHQRFNHPLESSTEANLSESRKQKKVYLFIIHDVMQPGDMQRGKSQSNRCTIHARNASIARFSSWS